MFKINHAGFMRREDDDLEIYRPHGSGDYIFVYFPVEMIHYIDDDTVVTSKDACIIYSPSDKCRFTGLHEFINSYVHFTDTEGEMKNYNFPMGEIFYPVNCDGFNEIIKKICDERIFKHKKSEQMSHAYMTELLIMAERCFSDDSNDKTRKAFEEIRFEMLNNYEKEFDLVSVLSKVCMSRTQFYKNYKKYFGISPKNDILRVRMEKASYLLADRNKTVSAVAYDVGFNSVEHFTRYYKKYSGKSPRGQKCTKHQ